MIEELGRDVQPSLCHYQFAYEKNRGTDDALMHLALKHLESPVAYATLMCIDFSSAFNTIPLHILLNKLVQLGVNPFLIKWYHSE